MVQEKQRVKQGSKSASGAALASTAEFSSDGDEFKIEIVEDEEMIMLVVQATVNQLLLQYLLAGKMASLRENN